VRKACVKKNPLIHKQLGTPLSYQSYLKKLKVKINDRHILFLFSLIKTNKIKGKGKETVIFFFGFSNIVS